MRHSCIAAANEKVEGKGPALSRHTGLHVVREECSSVVGMYVSSACAAFGDRPQPGTASALNVYHCTSCCCC